MDIRKNIISNSRRKDLGLKEGKKFDLFNAGKPSLCKLSLKILQHNKHIQTDSLENLVVSGVFDAYRSNIVAPGHLLTGIRKRIRLSLTYVSRN